MKSLKIVLLIGFFDIFFLFNLGHAQEWSEPVAVVSSVAKDYCYVIDGGHHGYFHIVWSRSYRDSSHIYYRAIDLASGELYPEQQVTRGRWIDTDPCFEPSYGSPPGIFFRSNREGTFCIHYIGDIENPPDTSFMWLYSDVDLKGVRARYGGICTPDPYLVICHSDSTYYTYAFDPSFVYMGAQFYLESGGSYPIYNADAMIINLNPPMPDCYWRRILECAPSGQSEIDIVWEYSETEPPYDGLLPNNTGFPRHNPMFFPDGIAFEQETEEGIDLCAVAFNESTGIFDEPGLLIDHQGSERSLAQGCSYNTKVFEHNWNGNWDIGFVNYQLPEPETVGSDSADDLNPFCYYDYYTEKYYLFWESNRDGVWNIYYSYRDAVGIKPERPVNQPEEFLVYIHPNPGNAEFKITLDNPVGEEVQANIFDISGRQVTELHHGWLNPGSKSLYWNASDLPSGIYLLQVQNYQSVRTQKIVLLK